MRRHLSTSQLSIIRSTVAATECDILIPQPEYTKIATILIGFLNYHICFIFDDADIAEKDACQVGHWLG